MPSTIPPTSVPHSEPKPPMMTASYAKISRTGPAQGVEGGADTDEHAADGDDRQGDGHGHAVEMAVVDTHELGGPLVVGGRPEGASHAGAGQEELQTEEDDAPR